MFTTCEQAHLRHGKRSEAINDKLGVMNVGYVPLPRGLLLTWNDIIDVQYSINDPGQRNGTGKTKTFLTTIEMRHSVLDHH